MSHVNFVRAYHPWRCLKTSRRGTSESLLLIREVFGRRLDEFQGLFQLEIFYDSKAFFFPQEGWRRLDFRLGLNGSPILPVSLLCLSSGILSHN